MFMDRAYKHTQNKHNNNTTRAEGEHKKPMRCLGAAWWLLLASVVCVISLTIGFASLKMAYAFLTLHASVQADTRGVAEYTSVMAVNTLPPREGTQI